MVVPAAAESDLESLGEGDQQTLARRCSPGSSKVLRARRHAILAVAMLDDTVAGSFRVTYVTADEHQRIFVVRIRKALRRDCAAGDHPSPLSASSAQPETLDSVDTVGDGLPPDR
jgi:hypothetical protein